MNELSVRTGDIIAAEINQIKRQTAQNLLYASVEIGRLLTEAKGTVPHGEWGQWLEANVDYSQSNANNLMRLYAEYGNGGQLDFFSESRLELFGNLSPSQALTLVSLPMDRRVKFVEENNVEEMSVRDLKAAIQRAEDAERGVKEAENRFEAAKREVDSAKAEATELRRQIANLNGQLAKAQTVHISSPEPSPEDVDAIRKEVEAEYQTKLGETEEQHRKEIDRLTKEKAKAEKAAKNAAAEESKTEIDSLTEKLKRAEEKLSAATEREEAALRKAKAAASADAQKLGIHFELVQRELNSIKECLKNLAEDPAGEKYRGAVANVLRAYLKELEGCAE